MKIWYIIWFTDDGPNVYVFPSELSLFQWLVCEIAYDQLGTDRNVDEAWRELLDFVYERVALDFSGCFFCTVDNVDDLEKVHALYNEATSNLGWSILIEAQTLHFGPYTTLPIHRNI